MGDLEVPLFRKPLHLSTFPLRNRLMNRDTIETIPVAIKSPQAAALHADDCEARPVADETNRGFWWIISR